MMAFQLGIGLEFVYILILLVCYSVGGPTFNVGDPESPRLQDGAENETPRDIDGMMDIMIENKDIDGEANRIGDHGHLVEGDIYIELDDDDDDDTEGNEHIRKRRNALRDRESLWPGGAVPYVIDGYFNDNHKKHILAAMQRFHEKSCIRLVPRTIERDYILFTQSLGCWSMVGRTGGRQKISLSGTCRGSRGVIMHELMHAIGFRHEHNRPDRDGYITVYWQNIKEGFTTNFKKYSNDQVQTLGTGYDFLSLMHYPLTAFSKVGNTVTISPRYPSYTISDVGNRNDFSHVDVHRINYLYKCGECEDTDKYYCPIWAMMGECQANKNWMTKYCPFSCDRCKIALANGNGLACIDATSNCKRWAKIGECERNPEYMLSNCRRSCKQCSAVDTETGETDDLACADDNTLCYDWATLGECESNAKFMLRHCRRSCHVCTGGDGRIVIDTGECRDLNPQCPTWAKTTRCQVNIGYMEENCRLSCKWCPPEETCVDEDSGCEKWARGGHCLTNEEGLRAKCQKSCGHCGEVEECRDVHRKCRAWTKEGWCTRSPLFMTKFCSPSCGLCDDNRPASINHTAIGTQVLSRTKGTPTKLQRQRQQQQQQTEGQGVTVNETTVVETPVVETPVVVGEELTPKQLKALKRAQKKLKQQQQRMKKIEQARRKAAKKNRGKNRLPLREDLDEAAIE